MSLRARSIALLALLVGVLAVVAAGCGGDDSSSSSGSSGSSGKKMYKIGVSNTLVGNGWREEMICSVKAQALASGQVSDVLVHNVNGDASAQIQGMRNLISSGAMTQNNQPTAEIYQVAVDNQYPYRVYGAQQDNTTVIAPSLPTGDGQGFRVGPGCETGPIR